MIITEQSHCYVQRIKHLANILCVQLLPYAEEITGEYQGGVRLGRSIVDQMFTASQIPGKKKLGNRK